MNFLLSDKLLEIDKCITANKLVSAQRLIDDVLDLEWENGKLPNSGKIYWRKLLIETGCRNNHELLSHKGKPQGKWKRLRDYSAFNNAVKYAKKNSDDNELKEYTSVEEKETLIVEFLINALSESEIKAKRATEVENLLVDYKRKLNEQKQLVQDNIAHLEEIEKSIRECVIDCEAISSEYKYTLDDLHSEAQEYMKALNDMLSKSQNEISLEAKTNEEKQLDCILSESNTELESLKRIVSNDPKYIEYNRLINLQKTICDEIQKNIDDLDKIQVSAKELAETIERITHEYAYAKVEVEYECIYDNAVSLLSKTGVDVDELFNKAIQS